MNSLAPLAKTRPTMNIALAAVRAARLAQHRHQRLAGLTADHRPVGVILLQVAQLHRSAQQGRRAPHGRPTSRTICTKEEVSTGFTRVRYQTVEQATPCKLVLRAKARVLRPAYKFSGGPCQDCGIRGIRS